MTTDEAVRPTVRIEPEPATEPATDGRRAPAAGARRGRAAGRSWLVRRWPGLVRRWPIALGLALFTLTIADGSAEFPPWIVLGVALVYPVVGVLRRSIRDRSMALLQAAGLAVFAGIAVLAAVVDPVTSAFVVAAGLVGHAVWDAFHHRAGAVVWRWYAEACVVYDLLVAAAVVAAVVA